MKIRIPGRPNGRTGWVRDVALGGLHKIHTALTIDQRTLTATLTKRGRVIWSSRVGMGKPGTPTPKGRFWIRERLAAPAAPTARGRSGRARTRPRSPTGPAAA